VLLELAKELKPQVWLNVHSGMYALFTPYDHKGHVPNTTGDCEASSRTSTVALALLSHQQRMCLRNSWV
jgi:hypothetical protein